MVDCLANPVGHVLVRLEGVRRTSRGWIARCPAHNDRYPSLTVAETPDGTVLLRCWAGCDTRDVVAGLGLTMADLFPAGTGVTARVKPSEASDRALMAALEEDIAVVEARLLLVRRSAERTGMTDRDPWWNRTVSMLDSMLDGLVSRDPAVRLEAWREAKGRWV